MGTDLFINSLGNDAYGHQRFKTRVRDAKGNKKVSFRDTRELITTVKEQNGSGKIKGDGGIKF